MGMPRGWNRQRNPGRKQELITENWEKMISGHVGSTESQGENRLKVKSKKEIQYMTEGYNDLQEKFQSYL